MVILPAIDIKDGECVRLVKGDYSTAHKVAQDAVSTARVFESAGAKWLHVVDLNGAKAAHPVNSEIVFKVLQNSGLKIEIGGGIRSMETIDFYLSNGVSRVILGSSALNDPHLVKESVQSYGERIAVGIDALNGKAAAQGWTETSAVDYLELAKRMEQYGVKHIIFTDISRDGTLTGPNLEMLDRLNHAVSCNIIASGGVSSLVDIADLLDLKLYGAICGKALYTGALDLKAAIALCGKGKTNGMY
ncbi:1-(5-phosphoribosyl)-5-[(5-phosphoribosylamino)methylideneamino]imidazole-4-carboxamide isomerase [Caproiciproducens sp. CPB-2]|uniref:1-(5-phosphoribosyl)-5-[(5- phosphoribosylamino)methylideneamino]imidazole-4- carboxamide isomerase n=1 Tax=Caproiciproducens sp. CPB-2 TaxID=3030017 RepID=UPI0023DBA410|nr:1-(5-phosphoribosyl)-5-[(5-phosphoribosylamino)methylideneamino]imidazole-4-carboxamide isomerase [Caproiciproducens sp. CPB-2]MDF1495140.1 1-(5-phosphoribosyl)-5-[(5-phosphoribosylamino)methylideneamino]imidazole-4-carboxamide isomerase [Caproiciproducens sp. CPB-2]